MKSLLVLSLVTLAVVCEAAEFQRVLGGPEMDRGVFVSPTDDRGYIVVGVTKNTEARDEDIYLVKTDSTGAPVWARTFGGSGEDNGWCVREIDGGYAVVGYTKSFGAGGFDGYLLALGPDGELRWEKTYGGETDDRCWGFLSTEDGGYALVGETVGAETGEEDIWLVKTDAAGEQEWSRTYGGEAGDRAFSIAQTADGGFMLAGQTYSEGAGDRDAYVLKTDDQGNKEWSRTFGGAESDVAHSVCATTDGNFLVTGYTASLATSGEDPYLIKIDAEGDTLWTRVLDISGQSRAITGAQAADGGFYLTGFRHQPQKRMTAALLVYTDPQGRLGWFREILSTSSGQSFGYTVRATADGGCVFTGHTTEGSAGDLDVMIIKVDPR